MQQKTIILLVAVAAIIGLAFGVYALTSPSDSNDMDGMPGMENMTESQMGQSQQDDTVREGETSVDIVNFAYAFDEVTVKKGTTVTWINQDDAAHDITADQESPDAPMSELLAKGESYSFTFDKVGEYSYYCTPHPYMTGKVTVVE